MTFILIAAVILGLGAAGLALGLPRLAGRRAPRWVGPAAAGAAMFAFMLWNEYSWFERSLAALPPETRVAETYARSSIVQPWTLIVPRVARFAAVIPQQTRSDELRRADVVLVERFAEEFRIPHLFDCMRGRRAALSAGDVPDDPTALDWSAPADDPLIAAACAAAEGDPNHGQDRPAG